MGEDEVLRVLARIARTGKPGDRLRAAELLGRQLGMFREQGEDRGPTLEDLVLAAGNSRKRLPEGAVTFEVVDPYAAPDPEDA